MLKKQKIKPWLYGTVIFLLCAMAYPSAYAASFTVTAQLAGDPREENPDGLIVDVTIDVVDDKADWTIDINSPLHPDIKLDEFYFNLVEPASQYEIDLANVDPEDWLVTSENVNVQGGGTGNASFLFEAREDQPSAANVTNDQNLTFTMYKVAIDSNGEVIVDGNGDTTPVNFEETDFYDALKTLTDLGDAQLGAHLQSLTYYGDGNVTEDSGFAVADYNVTNQPTVPVPGSMALLASGLVGLVVIRRRQIKN